MGELGIVSLPLAKHPPPPVPLCLFMFRDDFRAPPYLRPRCPFAVAGAEGHEHDVVSIRAAGLVAKVGADVPKLASPPSAVLSGTACRGGGCVGGGGQV